MEVANGSKSATDGSYNKSASGMPECCAFWYLGGAPAPVTSNVERLVSGNLKVANDDAQPDNGSQPD